MKNNSQYPIEISIIIPCYNKEDYIEECIKSVLAQQFHSFEIVMVDDGSTDHTGEICDRFAASDSRIRIFHTTNGGVTAARRYGLQQSRGRYVMFVDSDDSLFPNSVQLLYDTIEQTNADEVIGTCQTQHGITRDSKLRGWQDPVYLINDLLAVHNSFCVLWGIIFKRELLDGCLDIPREIITSEDILMQIKCLVKQPKVYFIGETVYLYNTGLPNHRRTDLDRIRVFDSELKKTLLPRWKEFSNGYLLHCIKTYESYLYPRRYYIIDYYKHLKKEDLSKIPFQDRIAFLLPARLAYYLIWLRKKLKFTIR